MTEYREQPHYPWQEDIQDKPPLEAMGILNSHMNDATSEEELRAIWDSLSVQSVAFREGLRNRGIPEYSYHDRVARKLSLISWRYADEPDRARFEKTGLLQQELAELRHSEASLRELVDVEGINLDFNR